MTVEQTPIPGAEIATEGQGTAPEGGSAPEPQKANKEAQYRVERNEAREALDAAQERIERMQRAEVERLAGDGLSHPADVFTLSGNELADYLTEDGEIDSGKVAADVAAILAERPGLRKASPAFDPSQGTGHPAKPAEKPASWAALFKKQS